MRREAVDEGNQSAKRQPDRHVDHARLGNADIVEAVRMGRSEVSGKGGGRSVGVQNDDVGVDRRRIRPATGRILLEWQLRPCYEHLSSSPIAWAN